MRRLLHLKAVLCAALISVPVRAEEIAHFTVDVLFQTCTTNGLNINCLFYGQHRVFETNEGLGTAPSLIAQLAETPINTSLQITGDLIENRVAEGRSYLRLTSIAPGPDDPYENLRAKLQGEWRNTLERQHSLRVTGSEWVTLFDGQELLLQVMYLADACPGGAAGTPPVVILRSDDADADEILCYQIDKVDAERMLLRQSWTDNLDTYQEWLRP